MSGRVCDVSALSWINLSITCTSIDLLLLGSSPSNPLYLSNEKHQNPCVGPKLRIHSLRWQCRCMLGVTVDLPYNTSTLLQNCSSRASAKDVSACDNSNCTKIRQARTKCLQHSKCAPVKIPLLDIREKYTIQFLNWSAVKDEKS